MLTSEGVYGGYRIPSAVGMWKIQEDFRKIADDYVYSARLSEITHRIVFRNDKIVLGLDKTNALKENSLSVAFGLVLNSLSQESFNHKSEFKKLHPQLAILKEDNDYIYVNLGSDNPFEQIFKTLPYVEEYGWIESEYPEEDELYTERESVWKAILDETFEHQWKDLESTNIGFTISPISDFSLTMLLSSPDSAMHYYFKYLKHYGQRIVLPSVDTRVQVFMSLAELREEIRRAHNLGDNSSVESFVRKVLPSWDLNNYTEELIKDLKE